MNNFMDHELIIKVLEDAKNPSDAEIDQILAKASNRENLSLLEVGKLLEAKKESQMDKIKEIAGKIKESIYGKRIVMFAPLYISDYCVNNCLYCGYRINNPFKRRKLSMEEIAEEVKLLESLGHKRLALEAGEDPVNCDINYILDAIDTIYKTYNNKNNIRRINVNIASTTVENYKLLKQKGIGTYILFQETYNPKTYKKMHPKGPKSSYEYHLTAFDRAMEAGIDDVGAGVLFGLSEYKYEILALMMHNKHLEEKFGVGFHTISVPRLKKAEGMSLEEFPNLVSDEEFIRIVTVLRLAVPFTGLILSTRESKQTRDLLIKYGVSQVSSGSCTGVGGYKEKFESRHISDDVPQFEISDERSPLEMVKQLVNSGYIPSYCTACYRSNRTGERFMRLAKSGEIGNVCEPNALMTLTEFIQDYGDEELRIAGEKLINERIEAIASPKAKEYTKKSIEKIKNNEKDFYI